MKRVMQVLGKLRQFVPCMVTAAIGLAVTAAVTMIILARDDGDAERQFSVLAENHFMVLQNGVNEYANRLEAVRALFDSSADQVTRNEFDAFTRPLIHENAAIATLSWVPRIRNGQRAAHERQGVSQGLPDYQIKAMTPDGKLVRSPERDEYFPIFYATVAKTSPLYGLDLGSEKDTAAELERACEKQTGVLTCPQTCQHWRYSSGFPFFLADLQTGLASRYGRSTAARSRRVCAWFGHHRHDGQHHYYQHQNAQRN